MRVLLILLIICFSLDGYSQNIIGVPEIINYTKSAYNAGTQNRGVVQDKMGIMYFANYQGLLSFDGTYWKTYPLPNKTVVRSIAIGNDNRIYVGALGDFGYFMPDKNGKLAYTSLKSLLSDKNGSFADIWFTVTFGNDVFFMSHEKIFQLNNKALTVFPAVSEWLFLGVSNHQLVAQDSKNGLLEFKEGLWSPFVKQSAFPSNYLVTCIFPFGKDSSFISTVNTGFYILSHNSITPFHLQKPNPFANERVLTSIPINKDLLAIGTNLDGVFIVNKNGDIIQNLSRKEDLQNNNILMLFLDQNKNLWLGLDDGIDFVAFSNSIKHIYPEKLNEGQGYTGLIFDNKFYVGTSNGLYSLPITEKEDLSFLSGDFKSIPGTRGSTWGLSEVNGALLLGHHDGAFQIKGDQIIPIDGNKGFWGFLPYSNVLPSNFVLAGNEKGISIFQYADGRFISKGNIPGYSASSQFIALDNNNMIWAAHPYRGIYRIDMSSPDQAQVKLYTEKNGLPSYLKNHLFKIKNHILIATEKGIYEYNEKLDSFIVSPYFKTFFGEKNIRYLKEDDAGNIWFIDDNNLGVIDFSGENPETVYFPELNGKTVADFEFIYPYNKHNIIVGGEKGFYHINYEEYKKNNYKIQTGIRSVRIFGKSDSLIFGGYFGEVNDPRPQLSSNAPEIGNSWNSIHFEYASPLYVAQNSVMYSYMLQGFDKDWSDWSKKTEKDYTNLPAGRYNFLVKPKSIRGTETAPISFSFTILPPWYFTKLAFLVYAIIFLGLNYLFFRYLRKRFLLQQQMHEKETKRLQYLHQLEIEKSEKEIVKLKNEKLEAEIGHKNKELASTAMHLVQKGELLSNVREELVKFKKMSNGENAQEDLKKLLKILNEENKMDKDWEQFAAHFDNVHSDFLQVLKTVYPNLSTHELKLSAYLRMNLSSKEIAQLENISVRGVEISRYRLRKKLAIPTETNLYDFLVAIHNHKKSSQNLTN